MNISLTSLKKSIVFFLHRFHIMIFAVVALGGLTIAVLLLNNVIEQSGNTSNYTPSATSATFDQSTINQINQLHTYSQSGTQQSALQGRTNPFVD